MRWHSRALLVATYGEPLCRAEIVLVGYGYPYPDPQKGPPEGIDHEAYEQALIVAREIAQHKFFVTHFHKNDEHVRNLMCGSVDGDVEAQALGSPHGGSWKLAIPVEKSLKFLNEFRTSKLVEGEPIARVEIGTQFSFPEFPLMFKGPPVQR